MGGSITVEDVLKLGNRRWNFQAEVEDLLLALKADILGPLHHTGEVSSRLDILTDAIVTAALLDEGVLILSESIQLIWFGDERTFGAFFDPAPAFDWGNGAGAAFFPVLGGCH